MDSCRYSGNCTQICDENSIWTTNWLKFNHLLKILKELENEFANPVVMISVNLLVGNWT